MGLTTDEPDSVAFLQPMALRSDNNIHRAAQHHSGFFAGVAHRFANGTLTRLEIEVEQVQLPRRAAGDGLVSGAFVDDNGALGGGRDVYILCLLLRKEIEQRSVERPARFQRVPSEGSALPVSN